MVSKDGEIRCEMIKKNLAKYKELVETERARLVELCKRKSLISWSRRYKRPRPQPTCVPVEESHKKHKSLMIRLDHKSLLRIEESKFELECDVHLHSHGCVQRSATVARK